MNDTATRIYCTSLPSVSGSGETPGATVTGGNLRARRDQQTVTMTSSDMQDTPAGRRAARADGPRSSQPKRRTFTAAYKMAMIEKYDAATEPGAKGVLLRGEGLYDSHISYWRKARDSGALKSSAAAAGTVPAVAQKSRPGAEAENERLRKRLAKAEVKLGQTRAALDIMGKAFALLEMLSESADSPKLSTR